MGMLKSKPLQLLMSFFIGACLLSLLSLVQKLALGFDVNKLRGYVVPFLFGGIAGMVIGFYFFKVKELNRRLSQRVNELEKILPICSHCKKIRKPESDPYVQDSWQQFEEYITVKTSSTFSHSICPDCIEKHFPNLKK